jgi:NAD(P)-dependent dehydrogenase (short-subunit alcohol dehydrogenase family)
LAERTEADYNWIDIRWYIVGSFSHCQLGKMSLDVWDMEVAVNLTAPMIFINHFLGSMKQKGLSDRSLLLLLLLFTVLRLAREPFTHMEKSPLLMKGYRI